MTDLQAKNISFLVIFQSKNSQLLTCFFMWLVQSTVLRTVKFHAAFVTKQK